MGPRRTTTTTLGLFYSRPKVPLYEKGKKSKKKQKGRGAFLDRQTREKERDATKSEKRAERIKKKLRHNKKRSHQDAKFKYTPIEYN